VLTCDRQPAPRVLHATSPCSGGTETPGAAATSTSRDTALEPGESPGDLRARGVEPAERASFGEERPLEGLVVRVGRRGV
jgi:hypothetical protein